MTDANVEVFRGRDARAETIERLAHPAGSAIATADLEGQFRIATAIANAADAVPRSYRKQPGAVLLALAWSQQHGLDILTTIQNVAFIEGKAVVDATMQRALAKRAGYELRVTVGPDYASVAVAENGKELGEATYSMADAKAAGLTGKRNWQQNQEDMLVARATTRAVRRFAPDVLLGMVSSDEVDGPPDIADVVDIAPPAPVPAVAGQLSLDDHAAEIADGPAVEVAENVPADEASPVMGNGGAESGPWASAAEMRADMKARDIKTADAIREAQAIAKQLGVPTPAGTLDAVFKHPNEAFVTAFAAWVRNHDARYGDEDSF